MSDKQTEKEKNFVAELGKKAARKAKAKKNVKPIIFSGLGMMGLVGWSMVIPTLLGVAIGHLLSLYLSDKYAWTLMGLLLGLLLGCVNAGYWVTKEIKQLEGEVDDDA